MARVSDINKMVYIRQYRHSNEKKEKCILFAHNDERHKYLIVPPTMVLIAAKKKKIDTLLVSLR